MAQHDKTSNVRECTKGFREITTTTGTVRLPYIPIQKLSYGEQLLIWRRRKGWSQFQAAKEMDVSLKSYQLSEYEKSYVESPVFSQLAELDPHEICFILRSRENHTIEACANEAGISRYWYNQMELGKAPADRLVEYWGLYEREQ